jgi:predicted NBD/HSP70 family sugar kinase
LAPGSLSLYDHEQAAVEPAFGAQCVATPPKDIFQAMLAKEEWACKIIGEMVDYLSIAVLNVSALIDPDLIVLRSDLDIYTDLLIEPILTRIEGLAPMKPRLIASQLGYRATALGTIVEVLHNTTNFYVIKKLK